MMEFHPSQIPAIKTFEIDNEKSATIAADQMVNLGFEVCDNASECDSFAKSRTLNRQDASFLQQYLQVVHAMINLNLCPCFDLNVKPKEN